MREINQEQLLKMTNSEKARTLKEICLGKVKYIGEKTEFNRFYLADMVSENMNHIPTI